MLLKSKGVKGGSLKKFRLGVTLHTVRVWSYLLVGRDRSALVFDHGPLKCQRGLARPSVDSQHPALHASAHLKNTAMQYNAKCKAMQGGDGDKRTIDLSRCQYSKATTLAMQRKPSLSKQCCYTRSNVMLTKTFKAIKLPL